jgi:hypothetical protein
MCAKPRSQASGALILTCQAFASPRRSLAARERISHLGDERVHVAAVLWRRSRSPLKDVSFPVRGAGVGKNTLF